LRNIKVKVYPSSTKLKKENQLAWKMAEIASDDAPLNSWAVDMVINRIIDNAINKFSSCIKNLINISFEDITKNMSKIDCNLLNMN